MDGPHQSRRRDDLAAALVRELKPPTSALAAVVELLQRQTLPADAVACVRSLAEEAARLTTRLTAAGELLQGGDRAGEAGDVVLRRLVDGLTETGGRSLLTALDGEPDLAVRVEEVRLRQVLQALIEQVGGGAGATAPVELALSARRRLDGVDLAVRVRGPCRPTAESLGLMLARRTLAGWDGGLIFSPTPGGGSAAEATLWLPLAKAEGAGAEPPSPAARGAGLHVLIVDDNATNRLVAEAFCEMLGCTSESAEDGLEALEAVRVRRFDVILMDVKMPRMDGVEATRVIRALPGPEAATPILALTANADPEDARRYRAAGMGDVIEKPIKADRLEAALNAVAEALVARNVAA